MPSSLRAQRSASMSGSHLLAPNLSCGPRPNQSSDKEWSNKGSFPAQGLGAEPAASEQPKFLSLVGFGADTPTLLPPLCFLTQSQDKTEIHSHDMGFTCSCVTGMRRCLESSRRVFRSVRMSSLQPTNTIFALGQNSWVSPCHCGKEYNRQGLSSSLYHPHQG